MFATIINVSVHSSDIYLCLMCDIADVNKRISSIFYKLIHKSMVSLVKIVVFRGQ